MDAFDKIDRHILRTLQIDGRATYDQLAEQVSLSPSAVLRRVKRLEETRVIDRFYGDSFVKPFRLTYRSTITSLRKPVYC